MGPLQRRGTSLQGQMGCRGPNDVTMGAQNNLQQQVRVARVGVKSRSLKMVGGKVQLSALKPPAPVLLYVGLPCSSSCEARQPLYIVHNEMLEEAMISVND